MEVKNEVNYVFLALKHTTRHTQEDSTEQRFIFDDSFLDISMYNRDKERDEYNPLEND